MPIIECINSNKTEFRRNAKTIVVIRVMKKLTESITVTLLLRFIEKNFLYHFRCL